MSNNQLIGSPRRRKKLRIPKFDPFGDYRQHIPQAISARMIVRSISSGVDLEERQQAVLQRYNVLMEDDVDFAAKRASQERRAKEMEEKEKKLEEVVDYWIEETKKPEYAQNITKQMHVLKRRKNSKPAPKKKTKVGAMVQNDEAGTHEERLDPLPAYSEPIVWPAYEEHYRHTVEMANEDPRITFLDGTAEPPSAEWLQRMLLNFPENLIRIQSEPIKTEEAVEFVSSSSCGATSVFIGTTRNTFHGKRVVKLSYECYEPMAYQELQKLCANIRERFPTIERIAMIHRIDEVPVGEASVIIATSSPHRKEAIEAVDVGINELKRTVPIWKREIYGDGTSSWKETAESQTGSGDFV